MAAGARAGLSFGIGVAGIFSALAMYYAFDLGLMNGPAWRNALVVMAIGLLGGTLAVGLDRWMRSERPERAGRPVKLKGPWACPKCGAAYVPEARECSDCHVPLVANPSQAR